MMILQFSFIVDVPNLMMINFSFSKTKTKNLFCLFHWIIDCWWTQILLTNQPNSISISFHKNRIKVSISILVDDETEFPKTFPIMIQIFNKIIGYRKNWNKIILDWQKMQQRKTEIWNFIKFFFFQKKVFNFKNFQKFY